MGSINSTTSQGGGLQLSQVTADPVKGFKKWHQSVKPELRNHLVRRLALTIFLTPDLQAIDNLETITRQYESDAYKTANSSTEYLHMLLMQMIKTTHQELSEKQSGALPGSGLSCKCLSTFAFSLFLSIPLYSEAVLMDQNRSQMILRLALGVLSDGGKIRICPNENNKQTALLALPFELLQQVLDANPDILIRQQVLGMDIIQLLLSCLAIYSKLVCSTTTILPSEFFSSASASAD